MFKRWIAIVSLGGVLAGCGPTVGNSVPTAYPSGYLPTVIYQTAQAINGTAAAQTAGAPTGTALPTATDTPIPDTAVPTNTPTPSPGVPLGSIRISAPGPMSKIITPLELSMTVVSGSSNKVQVSLYGEDGRLLGNQILFVRSLGSGEYVFLKIPFQIRAAAEVGILQVSTKDSAGIMVAINTLRVLLLSNGVDEITPAGNMIYERVALADLPPQATVSGGVVTVKGTYVPYNKEPLVLELVALNGKSLMNRVLTIDHPDLQEIDTTLPYKVSDPTPAYLVVRQQDDTLNGPAYLYSQNITLDP